MSAVKFNCLKQAYEDLGMSEFKNALIEKNGKYHS